MTFRRQPHPIKVGAEYEGLRVIASRYHIAVLVDIGSERFPIGLRRFFISRWNTSSQALTTFYPITLDRPTNVYASRVLVSNLHLLHPKDEIEALTIIKFAKKAVSQYRTQLKRENPVTSNFYILSHTDVKQGAYQRLMLTEAGEFEAFVPSKGYNFKTAKRAKIHLNWLRETMPENVLVQNAYVLCSDTGRTFNVKPGEISLQLKMLGGYEGDFCFTKEEKQLRTQELEAVKKARGTILKPSEPFGGLL